MKYYAVIQASSKDDYTTSEVPIEALTDGEAIEKARNIWLEKSCSQRELAEKYPDSYGGIYISLLSVVKVISTEVIENKVRIGP